MKDQDVKDLVQTAIRFADTGAREYLQVHKLQVVSEEALASCLKAWVKIKLPEALNDARVAIDCGMVQAGMATFGASMVQAGIEAAKEASVSAIPKRVTPVTFDESDCSGVFDGFGVHPAKSRVFHVLACLGQENNA